MKEFEVTIHRNETRRYTFDIKAENAEEAREIAREESDNHDWMQYGKIIDIEYFEIHDYDIVEVK